MNAKYIVINNTDMFIFPDSLGFSDMSIILGPDFGITSAGYVQFNRDIDAPSCHGCSHFLGVGVASGDDLLAAKLLSL